MPIRTTQLISSHRRFFGDLLLEGGEFPRGDGCCGVAAALDLALVGPLEGGADGDDPVGAWRL